MLKQHASPTTLAEAIRYFADPDVSLAFIVQLRWPSGVTCPHCKAEKPSYLTTRRIWKCLACRKQFSVKVGTIFEDSPLGLDKWLPALWLVANAKNGISSYEIHRALGVTQKTAWFMLHRIRLAMQTKSFAKMSGTVESDESYIGGRIDLFTGEDRVVLPGVNNSHVHLNREMHAGRIAACRKQTFARHVDSCDECVIFEQAVHRVLARCIVGGQRVLLRDGQGVE